MSKWKKVGMVALGASLGLIVPAVVVSFQIDRIVRIMMTPAVAFDAESPPPAPDYASPTAWSALPDRDDLADRSPPGSRSVDPRLAPADVFYVHPTSHVGARWNDPTDDAELNAATDRVATGLQASAFSGCCAIYAPRYRQANGTTFTTPSADGDRAIALAYDDVRRAFEAFNARRGAGRPFILAAHSQGSILAERLLAEAISGTELRDQLVAAYLIGGRVTEEGLHEAAPDIAPCAAPDDLHCAIAWNARSPGFVPTGFELHRPDLRTRLCTNPLTWRQDEQAADATLNLGAVFLETEDPAPRLAFADAQCVDGTLVVSHIGDAPRDLPSRVLDHVLGEGNHHPIEYQIFFMNLRQNAKLRVSAASSATR